MSCLVLAACASMVQSPAERADTIARQAGFLAGQAQGNVRSHHRFVSHGSVLTIYIEGDGARWLKTDIPPADPTPENPLSLRLAAADAISNPTVSVAYVGRPCQYLTREELKGCDSGLWRRARFSEAAIFQMSQSIDRLVQAHDSSSIVLVGYSGGGAMAALLAAKRRDVDCLVTIAAPLDTDTWASAMAVSRLDASLNPADFARQLSALPQWHFMGENDKTVPPTTAKLYHARMSVPSSEVIAGFDHETQWLRFWPDLLKHTCMVKRR